MRVPFILFLVTFVSYNCLSQESWHKRIGLGYGAFFIKTTNAEDYPNFFSHSIVANSDFEKTYGKIALSTSFRLGLRFKRPAYYMRVNGQLVTKYSRLNIRLDESTSEKSRIYFEVPVGVRFHNRKIVSNITFGPSFRIWRARTPTNLFSSKLEALAFIQFTKPLGKPESEVSIRLTHSIVPFYNWVSVSGASGTTTFSEAYTQFIHVGWTMPF